MMTSEQAMEDARNSMSDSDLARFRMNREEWVGVIDQLEAMGIYPDLDPRSGPAQEKYLKERAEQAAKGWYEI